MTNKYMGVLDLLIEHKYSVREIVDVGFNRYPVWKHHSNFPALWKEYLRIKKQIDGKRLEKKLKA